MKSIMIDMDNVITEGNFSRILEEYLGYKPDYKSLKGYYLQELLGDKKDDFFNKFKDINLYKKAKLLPNCYDVLKKLNKHYKIYICTDYIWKEIVEYAGNNLKNKYNFLYKKLNFIEPKNYIFAFDKSVIKCDIKIDDKIENIMDADIKILYTAYHNKNISEEELKEKNIIRVNNWKDVYEVLKNEF